LNIIIIIAAVVVVVVEVACGELVHLLVNF
jgi:hypothetical protein